MVIGCGDAQDATARGHKASWFFFTDAHLQRTFVSCEALSGQLLLPECHFLLSERMIIELI